MRIADKLRNKDILIWGYGREGKSTEQFINEFCSVKSLTIFEGKENEINDSQYDYIIKSPGIKVDLYREKYTSQTELFLEEFSSQTIGITGTKGKSTTSSMIYKVLSSCLNKKILLVGNIGLPCLNYYEEIHEDTVVVFEMSCHQLSHLHFSPHIAIFLNLYEDHLDYYGTVEKYFEAKKNIVVHQKKNDYYYYGENVPQLDVLSDKKKICHDKSLSFDMKLKGEHNQYNAGFVYAVCTELFSCSEAAVRQAIESFEGLPHRLEFVATVNGVDYYNDSISTIPEATIEAIKSISNVKTVMIGGMDRHIHYDCIIDFIRCHQEYDYILSYESGLRIYKEVSDLKNCYYKDTLLCAVNFAREITPKGTACLFSPAAASYGYFKNFEERGNAYKEMVLSSVLSQNGNLSE